MCPLAMELGIPPAEAVRMATLNPALAYGLENQGAIAPGYLADLIVLDNLGEMAPEQVYVGGERVWQKGETWNCRIMPVIVL